MGHENLPARFKNGKLGKPASRGLLGDIAIAPTVNGFSSVVPDGGSTYARIDELTLVMGGGGVVVVC